MRRKGFPLLLCALIFGSSLFWGGPSGVENHPMRRERKDPGPEVVEPPDEPMEPAPRFGTKEEPTVIHL